MSKQSQMSSRNVTAALVLLAFTAVYAYMTAHLPERTLPNTPDPSFFPWINTALALVLASALLFQGLFIKKNDHTQLEDSNNGLALPALAVFLAFLISLPYLGFILATIPLIIKSGYKLKQNYEQLTNLVPAMNLALYFSRITGTLLVVGFLVNIG